MKDAIKSCTVAKSPSFRVQVSNHIAQTVLPWNGEVQKGWHAGEVMLWFTWSIRTRTSRIHALPFGGECALFIPVVRTESFNYYIEIPFKKTWLFSGTGLLPLITAIGDGFPSQLVNLPTSGLWDFTKLPMNSQFGRICNPSMACWHDSLLSNNHLEPCPRTSEENPSRSKDDMTKTLFSSWEHSLNPWHFSRLWTRDRRDPVCVALWHMTFYDIHDSNAHWNGFLDLSVKCQVTQLDLQLCLFHVFQNTQLQPWHSDLHLHVVWNPNLMGFLGSICLSACEHHRLAHLVMRWPCPIVFT